ncbi:MAG TPA: DUF2314 domain-containing protein [Verrucomicrobiae bacterium]|nr:DUF2314 domain-containing protein [Verrucomicrobiae bacterium]
MRPLFVTLALTLTLVFGCSRSGDSDNYVHVADDDKEMEAAIARAVATTNDFMTAFRAQKPGMKNFCLKKPYPTPEGSSEHMWIEITAEGDGVFKGTVANKAEETTKVKLGQEVFVRLDEISDWKYEDGKKLVGGYTIRYFLNKMSAEERKKVLEQSGFEL